MSRLHDRDETPGCRCRCPTEIRHAGRWPFISYVERWLEEDHWMPLGFHRRVLAVGASLTAALALAVSPALAAAPSVHVLADGLNNPRGIDVGANGRVYVAEAGAGKILSIYHGRVHTYASGLPTATVQSPDGPETTGPTNVAAHGNGNVMAVVGAGPQAVDSRFNSAFRVRGHSLSADLQAFANASPDPNDLEGNPTDSNPYGAAWLSGSRMLVTDAAANSLLLVSGHSVQLVARFPTEVVSTADSLIPGLPPMLPAEAVPTTVTVGPDGYWYVGELKGFPFAQGASRIWRIAPWARDVTCDASAATPACSLYMDGFTSITGIDFGPDGALYVVEISKLGVPGIGPGTGGLFRVAGGNVTELVPGQLSAPGDVAVGRDGTVYVTNWSVAPTGQVLAIR
jgi:hypothetical protein